MRKRLLSIYSLLAFAFLYLPILVLVVFSFNKDKINSSWSGFTLDWYYRLFQNGDLLNSLKLSFSIALTSAIVSTVIGTFTAYALYKFNFKGKKVFQTLLNFPIITPDIVIGIGLLLFYVMVKFTLGYYSVLFAHITFNIAYTTLIISTRFNYIDKNLENAAIDLGAKPFQAFRYAIVPAITPGIIAAMLIAFTLSWDDFIVSFFTSGVGTTTLPVRVYSMIKMGVNPQINAISTITLAVSLAAILIALKFQKASNLLSSKQNA